MTRNKSNPVSQIISTSFCPLPTIKMVQKNNEKKIIYDAAHYMFRKHPLNKRLLIYQYQEDGVCYDFYMERTEKGWNDIVYTHPVPSTTNQILYITNGLSYVIKEEKEFQPLLLHISQQVGMMCRLLEL